MSIRAIIFGSLLLSFAPSTHCLMKTGAFPEASNLFDEDKEVPDLVALMLSEANLTAQFPRLYDVDDSKEALAKHIVALLDMYKSLPKNEHGNLDLPAVRYALQRHFDHRYRWFVHGLASNSSETHVAKVFRSAGQYDGKGFSLPDLAELAVTFDHLIRGELAVHLAAGYRVLNQSVETEISGKVLKDLARDYMTIYISGESWGNSKTRKEIEEDYEFLVAHNKDWSSNVKWIEQTTRNEAKKEPNCQRDDVDDCRFDFSTSVRIMEQVVEKYSHYNDHDCHKMKTGLLKMEEPGTGRVRLADFYKVGLTGSWAFSEKIDYLRDLGTLDESKPSQPRVIVTNYLSSWVNCLTSSRFYSVCCRDECEDFFGIIEQHIGGPFARVDQIMNLVKTHPTLSSHAPAHLGLLRRRLVDISLRHDERVPVHGRLFAQWMHHVFPRTCSYPQEADKKNPMPPGQWIAEKGYADIKASEEEIHGIMRSLPVGPNGFEASKSTDLPGEIPWSDVEDSLVISRPTSGFQTAQPANYMQSHSVLEVVGVVALIFVATRIVSRLRWRKPAKYKVSDC